MPEPIIINWDTLESESGFEPLPIGQYQVAITKLELKDSKKMTDSGGKEGYPNMNIELTIQEGEFKGRKLWDLWSMHPKAMPIGFGRALPAFGVKMTGQTTIATKQLPDGTVVADFTGLAAAVFPKLQGQQAIAIVKHEPHWENAGEVVDRVSHYVKLNGATAQAGPRSLI